MNELDAPVLETDPFQVHFHDLIVGSLVRSADARVEFHRAKGHRFRARRAERRAQRIRHLTGAPISNVEDYGGRFRANLPTVASAAWLASGVLLLVDVAVFGIEHWTTTVADLGVIFLTMVWFYLSFWQPR